nr:peptidylprolyl isomerase [Patescibacteria group bacterium]
KMALEDGSKDFCEAVSVYSDGGDSESCGEVGWFEKGYLEPEIASFVATMEEGGASDIIKSSLGYHIIFLEEKRKVEKDGAEVDEFRLKQIFVENGGFVEWVREEKKKYNVWVLMNDYKWEKETASIQFRDGKFEREENRIRIKSEGDPIFE